MKLVIIPEFRYFVIVKNQWINLRKTLQISFCSVECFLSKQRDQKSLVKLDQIWPAQSKN